MFRGVSGAVHTLSIYAKAGEYSVMAFSFTVHGSSVTFNLLTGTIVETSGTATGRIESVGNGWYRCSASTTSTNHNQVRVFIINGANYAVNSNAGDDYSGIYVWGAQLEAGSFPTSYIPTVASTVTRSADSATMTGTNFSDWYRQDEGSVYAEGAPFNLASAGRLYSIDDGTNTINNAIYSIAADASHFVVRRNGTTEATIDGGTFVANQFAKIAGAYKTNDVAASLDGSAIGTDTSVLLPSVSRMRIGLGFSTNYLNGTIKKLAYYPLRLTNNELVDLTEE
jgi:hypothetical protein